MSDDKGLKNMLMVEAKAPLKVQYRRSVGLIGILCINGEESLLTCRIRLSLITFADCSICYLFS